MYITYMWRLFTADILNEIELGQSSEHSNDNIKVSRKKRLRVVESDSESDDKEGMWYSKLICFTRTSVNDFSCPTRIIIRVFAEDIVCFCNRCLQKMSTCAVLIIVLFFFFAHGSLLVSVVWVAARNQIETCS